VALCLSGKSTSTKQDMSLQLERFAVYHDSDSVPWKLDKGLEELTADEWSKTDF